MTTRKFIVLLFFILHCNEKSVMSNTVEPLSSRLRNIFKIQKENKFNSYRARVKSMRNRKDDNDEGFHFLVTGGYRPEVNELAKYVVSIRTPAEMYFGDSHICGGTIISRDTILTAAHCLYDRKEKVQRNPKYLTVVAGTPGRLLKTDQTQEMEVRIIICHPRYSRQKHDVALLKLVGKLQIDNEFVGIMNITGKPPKAGLPCTTAGWGALFKDGPLPDIITNGDVQIQAMSKCRENEDARRLMSVGMICAGNPHNREIDACNGDSGGPLICENKLVGIVSWGVGCGRKDSYGFYTDVYYYKKFIDDNAATQAKVMHYLLLALLAICLL